MLGIVPLAYERALAPLPHRGRQRRYPPSHPNQRAQWQSHKDNLGCEVDSFTEKWLKTIENRIAALEKNILTSKIAKAHSKKIPSETSIDRERMGALLKSCKVELARVAVIDFLPLHND